MSGSRSDVWIPIYIGDLLGDTQHLTNEQFGIYHKILYHQWRHGHFSEEDMFSIAGFSSFSPALESASSTTQVEVKQLLSKCLAGIKQMLSKDDEGLLFSRRCDLEKEKATHNKRVFVERARKGGLAKARRIREGKGKEAANLAASSSASSVLEGMLEGCTSPSQVEEQKQKTPLTPTAGAAGDEANPGDAPSMQTSTAGSPYGTIAPEVIEAGRELAAGILHGVRESIDKAKTSKRGTAARLNGAEDVEPHQGRENSTARHGRATAQHLKNDPDLSKPDPRKKGFAGEISRFWHYQNLGLPELRFTQADNRALNDLLKNHPELTLRYFKQLLGNRAQSEVNPAAAPHKWLRGILDYAAGPLDRFGKLMRQP